MNKDFVLFYVADFTVFSVSSNKKIVLDQFSSPKKRQQKYIKMVRYA